MHVYIFISPPSIDNPVSFSTISFISFKGLFGSSLVFITIQSCVANVVKYFPLTYFSFGYISQIVFFPDCCISFPPNKSFKAKEISVSSQFLFCGLYRAKNLFPSLSCRSSSQTKSVLSSNSSLTSFASSFSFAKQNLKPKMFSLSEHMAQKKFFSFSLFFVLSGSIIGSKVPSKTNSPPFSLCLYKPQYCLCSIKSKLERLILMK